MSQDNITRLVVGESMTLLIGIPVGQQVVATDVSRTLRWHNGQWETSVSLVDRLRKATFKSSDVLAVPATKTEKSRANFKEVFKLQLARPRLNTVVWGAAVAICAIGVGVASSQYLKTMNANRVFLPIKESGPGKFEAAVRTVDAPFVRVAPEAPQIPQESGNNELEPVPTVSPQGTISSSPVRTTQPSAPSSVAPAVVKEPKQESKQQNPPAVFFDAEAANSKQPQPQQVQPVVQSPAVQKQITTSDKKEPQKESAPPPKAGAGLVAVTPDGKLALFTNPKTRLPEKYAVGDRLPNGETIKSIDKGGKVVTDAKEYKLE